MTKKFNLLINQNHVNTLRYDTLNCMAEHFNILYYQPGSAYSKQATILLVNSNNISNRDTLDWYVPFWNEGYKIAVDNLWEHETFYQNSFPKEHISDAYILSNPNWFWYEDSFLYKRRHFNRYRPNKNYSKLALMPIHFDKPHRSQLVVSLSAMLDQMVWSYASNGRVLPNDQLKILDNGQMSDELDPRYFNPEWYNSTYFSMVAETLYLPESENTNVFVTEKTYKPMAFYHPMMVMGQAGVLQHLKKQGFETFENLFDESYDTEPNWIKRIEQIKKNVENFKTVPYDKLTQQKLEHNYNLFYNTELVKQRIYNELIIPLLEYAQSR